MTTAPPPSDEAPPSDARATKPSLVRRLWNAGAVPAVLLVGITIFFLGWTNQFFPLRHWMFFIYLRVWGAVALFACASLLCGLRVLSWLLPEPPRLGERLLLGFTLGVACFFWAIFLGGVLHLYGHVFFFAMPVVLGGIGFPAARRDLRRLRAHLGRYGARVFLPADWPSGLCAAALCIGIVAVYLQVLTPVNVGADAVWYHLPVAEHYAAAGRLRPFVEGWYNGSLPQLASFLYAWAFQAPGGLFGHIALAAHVEFALFLATLAGVAVLVRRLTGARAPFAGALMFLFPGFLLYDSNLIIGADHVLAFWAPALGVALIRFARGVDVRNGVLAGIFTAAALLTKYQGIYFLGPAGLVVAVACLRTRRARPLLAWAIAVLVVSSAHWLKNVVFYGDPLYPHLRHFLPSHPFVAGSEELMNEVLTPSMFRFTGTPLQKLAQTLEVLGAFAFVPHDWDFHGRRPVFGALFTCLLVALPFVRARGRVWALAAAVHLGIVIWFVTAHEDRYLQALLPWMVASAAAILYALWKRGMLARAAAVAVVVVQAVYGDDVYFYRVHAMIGDSPLKSFVDFVSKGQNGQFNEQLQGWGNLPAHDLSKKIPKGGKLLAHQFTEKLGVGVESVIDGKGWQGAINYLAQESPAATLRLWQSLGITHVWWDPGQSNRDDDILAREAVFQHALSVWLPHTETVGHYRFGAIDARKPPHSAATPTQMAFIGCGNDKETGLYTPLGFGTSQAPLVKGVTPQAMTQDDVQMVLHREPCAYPADVQGVIDAKFNFVTRMGEVSFFARKVQR